MTENPIVPLVAQLTGYSVEQLLAPVSETAMAGESLQYSDLYQQINTARSQDDPTLPREPGLPELRQAQWGEVIELSAQGLAQQSKDLQLAVWLLEALSHRAGFAGIACGVWLIDQLCEQYWESLHPQQDIEHRCNLLSWINRALMPRLYCLPVIEAGEELLNWEQLEQAYRNAQLEQAQPREPLEGATLDQCLQLIAACNTEQLLARFDDVEAAYVVLGQLNTRLDQLLAEEAPGLMEPLQLLEQIGQFMLDELQKRGVSFDPVPDHQQETAETLPQVPDGQSSLAGDSRAEAYMQLSEIADYLAKLEPHSPVPCLLKRMVEWGNMSTSELYQQLFITGQGKINIFEVLGLEKNAA